MWRIAVIAAVAGGCGRLGFDASPGTCPPHAILCEDFESGDLDGWAQQISGGALELTGNPTHRGDGALRATTPSAGAGAYLAGAFSPVTTGSIHTRIYTYVASSPTFPGTIELTNSGDENGVHFHYSITADAAVLIVNDQQAAAPGPLPRDRWTCVEMRIEVGAAGGGELLIDGESAASIDGLDTALDGGYTELMIGVVYTEADGPFEVYVDDVVVATGPIGCQ